MAVLAAVAAAPGRVPRRPPGVVRSWARSLASRLIGPGFARSTCSLGGGALRAVRSGWPRLAVALRAGLLDPSAPGRDARPDRATRRTHRPGPTRRSRADGAPPTGLGSTGLTEPAPPTVPSRPDPPHGSDATAPSGMDGRLRHRRSAAGCSRARPPRRAALVAPVRAAAAGRADPELRRRSDGGPAHSCRRAPSIPRGRLPGVGTPRSHRNQTSPYRRALRSPTRRVDDPRSTEVEASP